MILRFLEHLIVERFGRQKAILLLGPRQTGKTTLVQKVIAGYEGKTLYLTGDDPAVRTRLTDATLERLRQLLGGYDMIVVDEAQRIKNVGVMLKLRV
jgi:hypothetical protein